MAIIFKIKKGKMKFDSILTKPEELDLDKLEKILAQKPMYIG